MNVFPTIPGLKHPLSPPLLCCLNLFLYISKKLMKSSKRNNKEEETY
jgi:hypothetical protein